MAEFNVAYEIGCWMKVKAKTALEAETIAQLNASAPFYTGEAGKKQGILYAEAGEPHDFSVVRAPRRPVARLNRIWKRVSSVAAAAKAENGRRLRTGGERCV